MMEAIRTSETSALTRVTRRHIPEDGILHVGHVVFYKVRVVSRKIDDLIFAEFVVTFIRYYNVLSFLFQTPFVMTIQAVRTTCSNGGFIQNIESKVGTDGPVPSLNNKYTIVKEIPQDALVSMDFTLLNCRVQQENLTFDSLILRYKPSGFLAGFSTRISEFLVGFEVIASVVIKTPIL
jgi:hypothetical protein